MSSYRISPRAERDLDDIAAHIEIDHVEAAIRVVNAILATFRFLALHSKAGQRRNNLGRNVRIFPAQRPAHHYVILYRSAPNDIEIVAVIHGSRNWDRPDNETEESNE